MFVRAIQVIRRFRQGATRPYLCRGDDKKLYVVKGKSAGYEALICEWICSAVGRAFGLPIPVFCLVEVSEDFMASDSSETLIDLGAGTWFGSLYVEDTMEFMPYQIGLMETPPSHESEPWKWWTADVLLWDWWIANGDRWCNNWKANPNLLIEPLSNELIVIDHNNAFQPESLAGFRHRHVFRDASVLWTNDYKLIAVKKMRRALTVFDQAWASIPQKWVESVDSNFQSKIRDLLWRFDTNPSIFWRLT